MVNGYFPLAGVARDGWSKEDSATATCYCGEVQFVVPTQGPGYLGTFVCNCPDCRKITGSMFATNFTIDNKELKFIRGEEKLKTYRQDTTIASKKAMTNFFCNNCGALMYRRGDAYPGFSFCRLGTVDDFSLHDGKFAPGVDQFTKDRVSWLKPLEGDKIVRCEGMKT